MRIEVHVHGTIPLRAGTTLSQVEAALRPWLRYIDEESLADARSVYEDEPGFNFDSKGKTLEICWTGDVGRGFRELIEEALQALCPYTDLPPKSRSAITTMTARTNSAWFSSGHAESIHERQKTRMIDDVSGMLARHFSEAEIGEVAALVNQLFDAIGPRRPATRSPAPRPPRAV